MSVTEIELTPQRFGNFRSVVPQGWRDAGEGAYAYAQTDIAIVQRHIAAPAISFVQPGIVDDLNLQNAPPDYTIRRSNSLQWRIYAGDTERFRVHYALAKGRGFLSVYMVLMQTLPQDHDTLYETLFLPTLDALQPT